MKTNFELSGLNVNFNNIKENECYAIDELIAAIVKESSDNIYDY